MEWHAIEEDLPFSYICFAMAISEFTLQHPVVVIECIDFLCSSSSSSTTKKFTVKMIKLHTGIVQNYYVLQRWGTAHERQKLMIWSLWGTQYTLT